ncbi:MAG: hypothetical protein RR543_02910 [Erysipelotrichales bacterium]
MKKIITIIILCIGAVLIRESTYFILNTYYGSLLINLIGSIIFIEIKASKKLTSIQQNIFNIVFVGSLTTYSGIFKVLLDLFFAKQYFNISLYFILMFILIPLLSYPIYKKRNSGVML